MRTGGQLIVEALEANGVDRIFCVPGESYLAVLDALHDSRIKTIVCRQEGGAAMMADCQGRLTGQPGICFVTRGPGATNASAGIHIAMQDSVPMILFVGQIARRIRDREAFQEVDYRQFFGGIAKWATEIDDPERNITTIEDPVEYIFPSANQIQINEQAGVTFAGGLRAILRQDPDVILVGEVRDVETARIAVQSALTGHLVFSSIHATDATLALQRFLDMGIESFLVASSVVGVVAQRLVRRVCAHCTEEYEPHADELGFYAVYAADETWHKDLWLLFAAAAASTSRIRLGPSISGVCLREPTLIAAQALAVLL